MRKLLSMLLVTLFASLTVNAQADNPAYDKAMADSLGANEYGMKSYILVLLKTGPNTTADKKTTDSLFKGHMANIGRLVADKQLIVAGPLKKNDKTYRGIFILNVKTLEEANNLLATDPAVKEGLLDAELYEWFGSAALPQYIKYHDKVSRKKM